MTIIGISGSPREQNTAYMLKTVLAATGQDYEIVFLKDKSIRPCVACKGCHVSYKCVVIDDMQAIYTKLLSADAIVLGSPTYFDNVTGLMKNFIDRCLPFYWSKQLRGKKAALVAVGNFKHDDKDEQGNCKWCKEETASVLSCLNALESYCKILELDVIGAVYATHSDPKAKEEELIKLGKRLVE